MVTDDNMGYVLSDCATTPYTATIATTETTIKADEPMDTYSAILFIVLAVVFAVFGYLFIHIFRILHLLSKL